MSEINKNVLRHAAYVAFDAADYTWIDLSEQDVSRDVLHPYAIEQVSFSVAKMPLLFERMAIVPPLTNWSNEEAFTVERVNGRIKVTGWVHGRDKKGFSVELFDDEEGEYSMLVDFEPKEVLSHFQQDSAKAAQWCKENTVELLVNMHYAATAKTGTPEYYTCPPNPANVKRRRQGKVPMYEWKTIVIDATVRKRMADAVRAAKPRAPQREHGVRGHWAVRKKSGKRYWVTAHKRGDASKGTIFHDYQTTGESK